MDVRISFIARFTSSRFRRKDYLAWLDLANDARAKKLWAAFRRHGLVGSTPSKKFEIVGLYPHFKHSKRRAA